MDAADVALIHQIMQALEHSDVRGDEHVSLEVKVLDGFPIGTISQYDGEFVFHQSTKPADMSDGPLYDDIQGYTREGAK